MKKCLFILICFISILSYAEFTANDSGNLAVVAREVEELENNSFSFFNQDWETFFAQFQAQQEFLNLISDNTANTADYLYGIDGLLVQYLGYLSYLWDINDSINMLFTDLRPYFSLDWNSFLNENKDIVDYLKSIDEQSAGSHASLQTANQTMESISSQLSGIVNDGLTVYLNGDPHVTATIENMPEINVNTAEIEKKIQDFNDDFDAYVDSFEGQSVYIQGSPLWSNLHIENEDDFGMSSSYSHNGTFFENLNEMISFLHLQNSSLNKSAYLIFKNVSGKSTEEERERLEDDMENTVSDISSRLSELKLDVDESQLSLNFNSNRGKLEIASIFSQFEQGTKPNTLFITIPSFGDFPAQSFNVDLSSLSDFIEKLRIFIRITYVILLAFLIWCLYRYVFPILLYLVNFIKKVITIQ